MRQKLPILLVLALMLGMFTSVMALPLTEGFESTNCPASEWSIRYANPSPPSGNLMTHTTEYYRTGARSFRFSSYSYGSPYDQYLITPRLIVTTGDQTVSFYYSKYTSDSETFRVGWSSTGTEITDFTWGSDITNASTTWQQYTKSDLPEGTKYVAVHYKSNYAYYLYLDDFVGPEKYVESNPPNVAISPNPANLATGVVNSATLSWASGGGAPTAYDVYFGTDNPPATKVSELQAGTTYNPGTLTYGQTYYWKIDPHNDYGYASEQSELPIWSFTVMDNPTIYDFPYAVNFDTETPPALPLNWVASEAVTGATQHWKTTTADASHGASAPHSTPNFAYLYCYYASTTYNPYYLTTPPMSLGSDSKRISYWYWIGTDTVAEPLRVEISTDQVNWTNLYTHSNTSNTLAWYQNQIPLSAYANETVYIRFSGISNYGSDMTDMGLDDIVVENIPAAPIFSVTPTAWDFGETIINTTKTKQFTVANNGGGTLNVSSIGISGSYYTLTENPAPVALTAGQTATFTVQYAPTVAGTHEGTVTINDNRAVTTVELDGTCFDPTIASYPYTQNFDGTWAGTPAAPTGWTVINANTDDYTWRQDNTYIDPTHSEPYAAHGMGNTNDYLITPPLNFTATNVRMKWWDKVESASYANSYKVLLSTTDTQIASFTVELANITCTNTAWTEHTLNLDAYAGQNVYVAFYQYASAATNYGFGIDDVLFEEIPAAPIFSINPSSHDYGQVQLGNSVARIFTITNTGVGTLFIDKDDITITGTDADLFTLNPIAEDISLGGNATAQITVNFAPVAEGMFSASLQIIDNLTGGKLTKSNGAKSTHLIPLTGEGYDASISTFPFAESFEGDTFPPVGWTTADLDGGGSYWISTNYMNHSESGSKCANHDYSADVPYPGQNGWLISPPIVIPAGTDMNLSFWNFNEYNADYVYNGVLINSTPNPAAPDWVELWSPDEVEGSWVNGIVSLSAYAGQTVYLAFVYQGYNADNWFLDDISIAESFDYPEDTPIVVGDNTITISGGNANNGTGEIPPVNNVAFTASASFYLELLGAGPWTITFETNAPWGAYYQGGHWYAVQAVDGVISFVITASKDLGIPIVLGSVDPTLPVELSSFTAVLTSDMFVNIAWVSESETNHAGYNIYRGETDQLDAALKLNSIIIDEGIAQGSQISYLYTDFEAYQNMEYYYWLESMSLDGVSGFFGPLKVIIGDPTQEPIAPTIPMVTKLLNAFPNPFNPNTNLRYSLKEAGNVKIDVYNLKGQLIRSFQNSHNTPGFYQVAWDGRDTNGQLVSSGIYMYRMTSGRYSATKKMILAK